MCDSFIQLHLKISVDEAYEGTTLEQSEEKLDKSRVDDKESGEVSKIKSRETSLE